MGKAKYFKDREGNIVFTDEEEFKINDAPEEYDDEYHGKRQRNIKWNQDKLGSLKEGVWYSHNYYSIYIMPIEKRWDKSDYDPEGDPHWESPLKCIVLCKDPEDSDAENYEFSEYGFNIAGELPIGELQIEPHQLEECSIEDFKTMIGIIFEEFEDTYNLAHELVYMI